MGTKKKGIIVVIFILVLIVVLNIGRKGSESERNEDVNENADLRDALTEEFQGAYSVDAESTGVSKEFQLTAAQGTFELADGITIDSFAYNEQIPGPEIRVKLGETVKVNFQNNLPQPTTIHWHGVRVPNAMDGVPGVTQEPIQPGESYEYAFTPKDPGTFWFHPHVRGSEQVEKGLYGVLIVEDPEDPEYSQDVVWVLDDWRITDTGDLDERFNTRGDLMHDGRWGNVVSVNGSVDEELVVAPGERIRLRLINTSNARAYTPNFGELEPVLIAVDGMKVGVPSLLNGFELAPGNRIDLDITIPFDAAGKTIIINDTFTRSTNFLGKIVVSQEALTSTPTFDYPVSTSIPLWSMATALPVDQEYRLDARRGGPLGIEWTINGKVFSEAEPITLQEGKFQKLQFANDSSRLHPMHLHGQFFKVLSRNGIPVNEGYWRDTVLIKSNEVIEVGLVPLDSGEWAMHCHILEHAEAGMMTTVIVEPAV